MYDFVGYDVLFQRGLKMYEILLDMVFGLRGDEPCMISTCVRFCWVWGVA